MNQENNNAELIIRSNAFAPNASIPKEYSEYGENISPNFSIIGLRNDVSILAILMCDLDVPVRGCLNHWIIWNISPRTEIPAGIPTRRKVYS